MTTTQSLHKLLNYKRLNIAQRILENKLPPEINSIIDEYSATTPRICKDNYIIENVISFSILSLLVYLIYCHKQT